MDIDRKTAFAVLLDVEKNEAFSNLALNRRIEENQPRNPAFVREMVYGVLKYQLLLDYQLDKLVKSGSKKQQLYQSARTARRKSLQHCLRYGSYFRLRFEE